MGLVDCMYSITAPGTALSCTLPCGLLLRGLNLFKEFVAPLHDVKLTASYIPSPHAYILTFHSHFSHSKSTQIYATRQAGE
jgi:hypothetical protein